MMPQQFYALADPLPEAMCLVTREGQITAANVAMTEMLGKSRQTLTGARLDSLLADPDGQQAKVSAYLQNCLRNRSLMPGAIRWLKDDGQILACQCEGTMVPPAPESSTPQVLLRCTPREATNSRFTLLNDELESLRRSHHEVMDQRAQLESIIEERTGELMEKAQMLERSNRELDQFAYVTSHDLKAPLRAISNLSQWIEEDIGEQLSDESRQQMALLRSRVQRMDALIQGILEYSRVGRVAEETGSVDVATLLDEVIDSIDPPPGFTINVAVDMPVIETQRVRLQQVFANLIGNAIKYRERDDGRIEVTVEDDVQGRTSTQNTRSAHGAGSVAGAMSDGFYRFTISDDGPGIAPEYHEKIFGIFQTLQSRDRVESTGVGLTLVKKIVEDQGGEITLNSSLGEGAMFQFTWPKVIKPG